MFDFYSSVYEARVKDPDMPTLRCILIISARMKDTEWPPQHASHSQVTAAATPGKGWGSRAADILNMRRMQPHVVALVLIVTKAFLVAEQQWFRLRWRNIQ